MRKRNQKATGKKLTAKEKFVRYQQDMLPQGVHRCPFSGEDEDLDYHREMSQDPRVYAAAHERRIGDAVALFEYYVAIRTFVGKTK